MLGSMRPIVWGLALVGLVTLAPAARAGDDPRPPADEQAKPEGEAKPGRPDPFGPAVPPEFVPLHPRTAADRDEVGALTDYAAARALEKGHRLSDAITLLEDALKKEPDSVAILRRLSLLHRARGRTQKAVEYAQQVLKAEPGDTETLSFLVAQHLQRNDPAGVEALLKGVLENPDLKKGSPAYLFAAKSLGDLYDGVLNQPQKAAVAFGMVVDALDEKAANELNPVDTRRILGEDPAATYGRFGLVFTRAKAFDLALKAFERGLAYEPEHPILPRLLAEAQLRSGQPKEALASLEAYLKRQPAGREPYDLLVEILTELKREDEILPRLEADAKANPKNFAVQNVLADRYRASGQADKADAIYKELIANQSGPEAMGALAASLLNDKKTDELIALLGEALGKPGGFEAVRPQLEAIIKNPDYVGQMLDAGLKLQQADPPKLSEGSRKVLLFLGAQVKANDKVVALRKLALKSDPSLQNYRELIADLFEQNRYDDLSETIAAMLDKYPEQKNPQNLYLLGMSQQLSGHYEDALKTGREALKIDPNDVQAMKVVGFTLTRMGKNEEAIAHYEDMLKRLPDNEEVVIAARSGMSVAYVNLEQFDKGEAELEILLEKHPDDPGVNNDLGYLYADRGHNLEKAEAMIRKAVEADEANSAYLDSLGWVLFKRGKADEALEPLEKAVEGPSVDATIHDHLGDVYFQLKRYSKAKDQWEQAAKAAEATNPPDKRLADIRKKLDALGKLGRADEPGPGKNP